MFLRRKKSLLANFYFLQPNCTYFKAINQKCGTCIYLNIIILVKQLAGNELFVLQYSLCCAQAPNGIISVEFIEWERTNRKLHTFIFLIVTWDQILYLQDKNTLQEKHLGLQMQNAQEIRIRLSRCVSFSDHKCLRQKLKITFARCNFKPFDTQRCINDTLLTFYWKKIIINQNQLN